MNRVLLPALGLVVFVLSGTAFAHPHYDVAAVAGNAAALPFLIGIGVGMGIGLVLGTSMRRKDPVKEEF